MHLICVCMRCIRFYAFLCVSMLLHAFYAFPCVLYDFLCVFAYVLYTIFMWLIYGLYVATCNVCGCYTFLCVFMLFLCIFYATFIWLCAQNMHSKYAPVPFRIQGHIFDSLSGKLMLKKKAMEQIVLRCFYGVKKVIFQYGDGKLQGTGALTCSEHVIYYVLYQNIFYLRHKRFDLDYTSKITKYCLEHRITPDELVWEEIYINLELAKPPNLMKVLNWYETTIAP